MLQTKKFYWSSVIRIDICHTYICYHIRGRFDKFIQHDKVHKSRLNSREMQLSQVSHHVLPSSKSFSFEKLMARRGVIVECFVRFPSLRCIAACSLRTLQTIVARCNTLRQSCFLCSSR